MTSRVLLKSGVLARTAMLALLLTACQRGGERAKPRTGAVASGALIIAYSPDAADTFACVIGDSVTVLDRLVSITRSDGIALSTKAYPFGVLVERIGHRQNGEGGYWLYTVNGIMVPESAGSHRIAAEDTVRFFFNER